MTDEQEAIAQAVLNTPEPDRFVDCGESRPLPMFHMATLMQYGEQCANAALAYLRSQGAPVAWMTGKDDPTTDYVRAERWRVMGMTVIPLYLAPVANVPAGWKLVPMEPTPEMVQAWLDNYDGHIQTVYRAMLAAAPEYKEK